MDARSLARALGGEASGNSVLAPGPGHKPNDRSLSVKLDPSSPDGFVVHSFSPRNTVNECRDHVRKLANMEPFKPNGQANGKRPKTLGPPDYTFRYEGGGIVYRWDNPNGTKTIKQGVQVGDKIDWHAPPSPRALYRLKELREKPEAQVIVVEGEKKADALAAVLQSVCVISWSQGASSVGKSDWSPLAGRRVVIWPDNDVDGASAANDVALKLVDVGASVRYLSPMCDAKPIKWDAWDAIHKDGMDAIAIVEWAKTRIKEWSEDDPVVYSVKPISLPATAAAMPSDTEAPPWSDESMALYFAGRNDGELRYVSHWGRWKLWDGRRWIDDRLMVGMNRVREICRETAMAYATTTKSNSGPKSIASSKTVNAVLSLSRSDPRLAATVDQWDEQDGLLNTPAGTLNLDTLVMQPHEPGDHITKMTEVAPGGECPTWISFLNRITGGDLALQLFLRRVAGYALTGLTIEHALFFLYGTGANGKSVFLNTIGGILGDYHTTAPIETFTQSRGDRHPTELARLQGARLVTAVETEEGRRWAESRIKSLTGGDKVAARFMKQDFFEYFPKFKLIIAGNHKPGLRSVDEAIRRRFNLIPFAVTIPVEERDDKLTGKLRDEWSGIFQWMIGGCREWMQLRGLRPPEAVSAATAEYLEAEDAVAAWIEDCCDQLTSATEGSRALYRSWKAWAATAGEISGSEKTFSQTLESRGYHKLPRTSAGMMFQGLRLKPTDDNQDRWYDDR